MNTSSFFPGGTGITPGSSACYLFATVWWDGRQYQQQGGGGSRPDLVAHAQAMIASNGGSSQQSVVSPDGSTWLLQYNAQTRAVSILQCTGAYDYGYNSSAYSYPVFGPRGNNPQNNFSQSAWGSWRGFFQRPIF